MNDTSICPNCGDRLGVNDRFCTSCGARLDEFAPPEDERPAPTFPTEAVIRAVPPPGEPPAPVEDDPFSRPAPTFPTEAVIRAVPPREAPEPPPAQERSAPPGLIAAGIAGSAAAGIVLVAGLLIAIVTPDQSIIGAAGVDASLLVETFRQAVGTLLAPMIDTGGLLAGSRRIHPLLLLAIPLTALALTTRWQLHRTEGAPPVERLGWALATAVPFGLLMLVFAVIGGDTASTSVSPSVGNALLLGLLWGALGGFIGAATRLPLAGLVTLPPAARTALTAATATLRPLAALVLTCTALAFVGWMVQVGENAGDVRNGRSAPTALIEEAFFSGEHGIHLTALAAGVLFRPDWPTGAIGLPFPVGDPNAIPGSSGAFRIFAYGDALPAYFFLPMLVILLSLVALSALYAGFAAARAVGADRPQLAAAWGAITGPAWAIAMAALLVLAGGLLHGDAGDGSAFGIFLIGGALLGAAGGALSAAGNRAASSGAPG